MIVLLRWSTKIGRFSLSPSALFSVAGRGKGVVANGTPPPPFWCTCACDYHANLIIWIASNCVVDSLISYTHWPNGVYTLEHFRLIPIKGILFLFLSLSLYTCVHMSLFFFTLLFHRGRGAPNFAFIRSWTRKKLQFSFFFSLYLSFSFACNNWKIPKFRSA